MGYDFDRELGRRVRKFRKSKKWTQEKLAARLQLEGCDLSRGTVAKMEIGRRHLYAKEIYILKQILQVSYDQLFEDEAQKTTDD